MSDQEQEPEKHEDVGLYQKMADRAAEILADGKKTLDEALKKAREEMTAGGEYSREQAEKIAANLRRDLGEVGKKSPAGPQCRD